MKQQIPRVDETARHIAQAFRDPSKDVPTWRNSNGSDTHGQDVWPQTLQQHDYCRTFIVVQGSGLPVAAVLKSSPLNSLPLALRDLSTKR